MQKKKFLRIFLVCLLIISLVCTPVQAVDEDGFEAFSCFTYDEKGRILDGYWSETDGVWYLFLTSAQTVAEVELHYTGAIIMTSAGTVDVERSVVTGAFTQSGDRVELTGPNATVYTVVVMQSKLPSVYIDLEGTTLNEIHADKTEKHKGNSIYIMSANDAHDLAVEDTLQIQGHGSFAWQQYDKKAYEIRFHEKTSVLGLEEAQTWTLLANAADDSMMRSQLVYTTAEKLGMDFVPSFEYVDLWIEGEYRGTFLLGEKVELGDSRLNLENDAGALFVSDGDDASNQNAWFLCDILNRYFAVKQIVKEEDARIQQAAADFDEDLSAFVRYLYETPAHEITLEKLSAMIDVDAFAKYYLIHEFTLNRESFAADLYWYQDGGDDVIHLGPIWDFDTCMGNNGEPNTASCGDSYVLFHYLLAIPEFRTRTQELWEQYRPVLCGMAGEIDTLQAHIADSAAMNYARWDVLGRPNPNGGADFCPTFAEAAAVLKTWLAGREAGFSIPTTSTVTSRVSADCCTMDVAFQDGKEYGNVAFAVWSQENGIDDITWYTAKKDATNTWRCNVDLRNHNSAGIYYINAYDNDHETLLASGRNYVATAQTVRDSIRLEITEAGALSVRLGDTAGELTGVRFALWTDQNQEATLRYLEAEQNEEGFWVAQIPACVFQLKSQDTLVVHAYSGDTFINGQTLQVFEPVPHVYPEENVPCVRCDMLPGQENKIATTPMFRLYNPNSGEHFYTGSVEERDYLASLGWQYEGVAWHAPIAMGLPVYRMFNPNSGDHHYTMSEDEVTMLREAGWHYEGIAWNSAYTGSAQFRLYNPNADLGSHHYTSSTEERDFLVSLGWIYEGIGWYGVIQ